MCIRDRYIRKGAAFNGSRSFIETPSLIPTNDFTFSCWVYFDSLAPSSNYSMIYNAYKNTFWYLALYDGGKIATYNGTTSLNTTSNVISAGQWHHIVYTSSSTNGKNIYLDGNTTPVATVADNTGNSNPSGSWEGFGKYYASPFYYLQGKIDQVRIFNKAVSVSEVTTLYGETYASSTKSTTDIFGDGSAVALYELDENANDTGTNPYGTGAIDSGQSAVFNGSSSKIDITGQIPTSTTSDYAISTWVNADNLGSAGRVIFSNFGAGGSFGTGQAGIYIWNSKLRIYIYAGTGSSFHVYDASSSISTGQWYHIAVNIDINAGTSTSLTAYINNEAVTLTFVATTTISGNSSTQFGTAQATHFWDGKIDQARIYSAALSSSDVLNLIKETNVPTANLVAWYKFDGNANDSQGSNNGTWSGTEAYADPATFPFIQHNGTATNINFLGMAFAPDFVWIKQRSSNARNHNLTDTVRGADRNLASDTSAQEFQSGQGFSSFDSNGFTLDNSGSGGGGGNTNLNGVTHVAWCWKAGGTPTATNSAGAGNVPTAGSVKIDGADSTTALAGTTAATKISANTKAGFSIATFTGSGVINVGHGLSQTPELIIRRRRNFNNDPWAVYSSATGTGKYLRLNEDQEVNINSTAYSAVNSTTYTSDWSSSTYNFISYHFHSVAGYQKVGTYSGTGTGTNTIATGFIPRFVMIKRTDSTGYWVIIDSLRENGDKWLYANTSDAEYDDANLYTEISATDGFIVYGDAGYVNASGTNNYLYLAIA